MERVLKAGPGLELLSHKMVYDAKRYGLSDKQIGRCLQRTELEVRKVRKDLGSILSSWHIFVYFFFDFYKVSHHL